MTDEGLCTACSATQSCAEHDPAGRPDGVRAEEQCGGTIIDLGVRWGDGELSDAEFVNRIVALFTQRDARLAAIRKAIYPKDDGSWTDEQIANLASAHRDDSLTMDDLDRDSSIEGGVRKLHKDYIALRARLAAIVQEMEKVLADYSPNRESLFDQIDEWRHHSEAFD